MIWHDDRKDNHEHLLGSFVKDFKCKGNTIRKCRVTWKNHDKLKEWQEWPTIGLCRGRCKQVREKVRLRISVQSILNPTLRCLYFIPAETERQVRFLSRGQTLSCIYWAPSIWQDCSRLSIYSHEKKRQELPFSWGW